MKCPQCQHQQQNRLGMTCLRCHYRYLFEPKADGTTDGKFMALMRAASANNTYYFTANQMYSAYAQKNAASGCGAFGCLAFIAVPLVFILLGNAVTIVLDSTIDDTPQLAVAGILTLIAGLLTLLALFAVVKAFRAPMEPPDRTRFDNWLYKWQANGRPMPKLIRGPTLDRAPGPYREQDIYDYGVERIIIVQHRIHVDLFVKNNMHTAQRALVVSEDGYPSYLISLLNRVLTERPQTPVFILHDGTPEGLAMQQRLHHSAAIPALRGRQVIDVGIRPDQVQSSKFFEKLGAKHKGGKYPLLLDYAPIPMLGAGLAAVAAGGLFASALIPPAHAAGADGAGADYDFG